MRVIPRPGNEMSWNEVGSKRGLTDQEVDPDERFEGLKGFAPEPFVEEFFRWFAVSWAQKVIAQAWTNLEEWNHIGKELVASGRSKRR